MQAYATRSQARGNTIGIGCGYAALHLSLQQPDHPLIHPTQCSPLLAPSCPWHVPPCFPSLLPPCCSSSPMGLQKTCSAGSTDMATAPHPPAHTKGRRRKVKEGAKKGLGARAGQEQRARPLRHTRLRTARVGEADSGGCVPVRLLQTSPGG